MITTRVAAGDPGGRHADIAKRLANGVPCDLIVCERDEKIRLLAEARNARPA